MTTSELDRRLAVLHREAKALQTELVEGETDVELAVALGAISAVVVVLASLLPLDSEALLLPGEEPKPS